MVLLFPYSKNLQFSKKPPSSKLITLFFPAEIKFTFSKSHPLSLETKDEALMA